MSADKCEDDGHNFRGGKRCARCGIRLRCADCLQPIAEDDIILHAFDCPGEVAS